MILRDFSGKRQGDDQDLPVFFPTVGQEAVRSLSRSRFPAKPCVKSARRNEDCATGAGEALPYGSVKYRAFPSPQNGVLCLIVCIRYGKIFDTFEA